MNFPLRNSTAGQVLQFVMVDATTGLPKSGLSIANTDIKLYKEGSTSPVSKNSGGATEVGSTGLYYATFDATDSNTLGRLHIGIENSGALPYFKDTAVLNTALWDALYAASGGAIPNVVAGGDSGLFIAGTNDHLTVTGAVDMSDASNDIAGISLAAGGLDDINATTPTGVATVWPQMVVQLFKRFFNKAQLDSNTGDLTTFADDDTTVITTQATTDSGGIQTQGKAS